MTPRQYHPFPWLGWLVLLVLALCCAVLGTGCFRVPVTVHPPHAPDGQPIALPTAPTGVQVNPDGSTTALNPAFPQPRPSDHKPAGGVNWEVIIGGVLTFLTGTGGAAYLTMRQRARELKADADEGWERALRPTPPPGETWTPDETARIERSLRKKETPS